MDPDVIPEKHMLGGLGPPSQQIAALPRDVRCKHVSGFGFDLRPETCLPRPISGPSSVPEIGPDPMENLTGPQ